MKTLGKFFTSNSEPCSQMGLIEMGQEERFENEIVAILLSKPANLYLINTRANSKRILISRETGVYSKCQAKIHNPFNTPFMAKPQM